MLSQAGLPQSTDGSMPQADTEQAQLQGIVVDTNASQTNQGQSQAGLSASLGSSDLSSKTDTSPGDLPDDWDWESYLQLNPDVAAAVGQDPAAARQHWQKWGQLEQRPYKVGHCFLSVLLLLEVLSNGWHGPVTLLC